MSFKKKMKIQVSASVRAEAMLDKKVEFQAIEMALCEVFFAI